MNSTLSQKKTWLYVHEKGGIQKQLAVKVGAFSYDCGNAIKSREGKQ